MDFIDAIYSINFWMGIGVVLVLFGSILVVKIVIPRLERFWNWLVGE